MATPVSVAVGAEGGTVIHVVTRCASVDELIDRLAPFAAEDTLLIPAASGLIMGTTSRFAIVLSDRRPVLRGLARLVETRAAHPGGPPIAVRLRVIEMDPDSRNVRDRMLAHRRTRRPSALPPPLPGGRAPSIPPPAPEPEPSVLLSFAETSVLPNAPDPLKPSVQDDSVTRRVPFPLPPGQALGDGPDDDTVISTEGMEIKRHASNPTGTAMMPAAEDLPPLAPPIAGRTTGKFTGKTTGSTRRVARKPWLPAWIRAAGTGIWHAVPEDNRPGVAKYGPWVLCGLVGFALGFAAHGRSGGVAAPAAAVVAARTPEPSPLPPPPPAQPAAPEPPVAAEPDKPTVTAAAVAEAAAAGSCVATIKTDPPGASVQWGDSVIGETPVVGARVACGRAFVTLKRPRYEPLVRSFTTSIAAPLSVTERLKRPEAQLLVESKPAGGHIKLNGQDVGVTPGDLTVSRFESVKLDVVLDGYEPWSRKIYMDKTKEKVDAHLKANKGKHR